MKRCKLYEFEECRRAKVRAPGTSCRRRRKRMRVEKAEERQKVWELWKGREFVIKRRMGEIQRGREMAKSRRLVISKPTSDCCLRFCMAFYESVDWHIKSLAGHR